MNSDFVNKHIVVSGLFKIYNESGIRCFAIKNGKIDQHIWKKTEQLKDREDLILYFTMGDYDLGFVREDGIIMRVDILIQNGHLIQFGFSELIEGEPNELT